jgi:hypothetical protein
MTLDELKARAKQDLDNAFEKGKAQGGGGETQNPLYYMVIYPYLWRNQVFPDGYELIVNVKNAPSDMTSLFNASTGLATVTLVCEEEGAMPWAHMLRASAVEIFDITKFTPLPTSINNMANACSNLVSILGVLDLSNCTNATSAFRDTNALKDIRFKEGTISIAIDFKSCEKLSAESYDSIIRGCSKTASFTLTLPAYNTVKTVFDEKYGQRAWGNIISEYPNVTIVYS